MIILSLIVFLNFIWSKKRLNRDIFNRFLESFAPYLNFIKEYDKNNAYLINDLSYYPNLSVYQLEIISKFS